MKVYKYESNLLELKSSKKPIIFAAGPTVRGNQPHLTSWRIEAVRLFEEKGFDGSLIIPEFTSKVESDKGKTWIPMWEFAGLNIADAILFWIPRSKELIGLTTNFELGYYMAKDRDKVIYGRPDDSYRNGYPDIMWDVDAKQNGIEPLKINTTLSDTIDETMRVATVYIAENRVYSRVAVDSPYGAFQMWNGKL